MSSATLLRSPAGRCWADTNRTISLRVSETELAARRADQDGKGWHPTEVRKRNVTTALKAYAAFATSADRGAVRDLNAR